MVLSEIPNAEGGGMHIAKESFKGMKPSVRKFARIFQRCYFVYILASLRGHVLSEIPNAEGGGMHIAQEISKR